MSNKAATFGDESMDLVKMDFGRVTSVESCDANDDESRRSTAAMIRSAEDANRLGIVYTHTFAASYRVDTFL